MIVLAKKAKAHSELSDLEVRIHLNELDWLHLVKEALPRPGHEELRSWNVTEKGLQEISHRPYAAIILLIYQLVDLVGPYASATCSNGKTLFIDLRPEKVYKHYL